MATVYSLICFGGLSGKAVTFTDTGDVVNLTNHGLRQGVTGVVFSTTGSLPTGITAGATYYPRDGSDVNKFTLYPTKADALAGTNQITFTGAGSGTHTVKSAHLLTLTSEQLSRYGERVYDGLVAWFNARKTSTDYEVCEIDEEFTDIVTSGVIDTVASLFTGGLLITTVVAGIRSSRAFHGGVVTDGYIVKCTSASSNTIRLQGRNAVIDGVNLLCTSAASCIRMSGSKNTISNCISKSAGLYAYHYDGNRNTLINNLSYDSAAGFFNNSYSYFHTLLHNTNAGGTVGFYTAADNIELMHNNVSVGASTDFSVGANLQSGDSTTYTPYFVEFKNNASAVGGNSIYSGVSENGVLVATIPITSINTASPAICVKTAHGLITGNSLKLVGTTITAGLTKYRMYYVGKIDDNNFYLYDTYANAIAAGATGRQNLTGANCTAPAYVPKPASAITTLTTDCFVNYAAKDFRPALTPATGTSLVGAAYIDPDLALDTDILGYGRPGYNNGAAETVTIGCFEYDRGYGPRPASGVVTITSNISLVGAEIRIYDVDLSDGTYGTELSGVESNSSPTYTYSNLIGNTIAIQVMLDGYEESVTQYTFANETASLNIILQAETNA